MSSSIPFCDSAEIFCVFFLHFSVIRAFWIRSRGWMCLKFQFRSNRSISKIAHAIPSHNLFSMENELYTTHHHTDVMDKQRKRLSMNIQRERQRWTRCVFNYQHSHFPEAHSLVCPLTSSRACTSERPSIIVHKEHQIKE